ncbi:nuclear transport factor 2 family protein [Devosia sp.]|uniref:nuclear transport factor 2 family protein n=1 Tax=Devosia sp. TaxID=1871048 RepID=UPI003A8EE9DC
MAPDPVSRMFVYWNGAFAGTGFTAEGFVTHFADDARLIVNGQPRASGPAEIARHFEAIRTAAQSATVTLPLLRCLTEGNAMFVKYRVDAVVDGTAEAEEAMAYVELADGRIALMEVLSRPLD